MSPIDYKASRLNRNEARKQISKIVSQHPEAVRFTGHAREELEKDDLTTVDAFNVLKSPDSKIHKDGELEYVNCGHVPPLLVSGSQVTRPQHGNLPVGLLADAQYESDHVHLKPGDRFILVTDGVTEAENALGEFYDNERLEAVAAESPTLEGIFASVSTFCAGNPLGDDCTVVELLYTG